jgi:hypothetical protein
LGRPVRRHEASDAKRLKELEVENTRLKKLLAEAELDKAMLKEIAEETSDPEPTPGRRREDVPGPVLGLERRACRVVGQHRSTQRLEPPAPADDDAELRAWLREPSKARPRCDGAVPPRACAEKTTRSTTSVSSAVVMCVVDVRVSCRAQRRGQRMPGVR